MKTIAFCIYLWIAILIFFSLASAQHTKEILGFATICGTEGCLTVQKDLLLNLAVIGLRKVMVDGNSAVYMDIHLKGSKMGELVPLVENFCLGRLYCGEFHCSALMTDLWTEILHGYQKADFVDLTPIFAKHHSIA